jgi:PKD domain
MKKIIYFSLFLSVILYSCEEAPEAGFHTDTDEAVVGNAVFFYNDSHNAESFEWDFGDGYISNDPEPVHIFEANGTFEVRLTAISKNGRKSVSSLSLNVVIPTLLEIEVAEYYDQYVVPAASVIIYPTITDWDNQTNSVYEGFTDDNGIVVFSGLDPFVYYVDVWEQNYDNYALRAEDMGFVRTPEIIPHQINRFTAWVDYVVHAKGTAGGTREMVIRKLQRKAPEQLQTVTDTQNWRDLYNRRANK